MYHAQIQGFITFISANHPIGYLWLVSQLKVFLKPNKVAFLNRRIFSILGVFIYLLACPPLSLSHSTWVLWGFYDISSLIGPNDLWRCSCLYVYWPTLKVRHYTWHPWYHTDWYSLQAHMRTPILIFVETLIEPRCYINQINKCIALKAKGSSVLCDTWKYS